MSDAEPGVYVIDHIITHRVVDGVREYYVAWENYPGEDSWIRREDFNGPRMVNRYEARLAREAARRQRNEAGDGAQRGRPSGRGRGRGGRGGSRGQRELVANNAVEVVANAPPVRGARRGRGRGRPLSRPHGQRGVPAPTSNGASVGVEGIERSMPSAPKRGRPSGRGRPSCSQDGSVAQRDVSAPTSNGASAGVVGIVRSMPPAPKRGRPSGRGKTRSAEDGPSSLASTSGSGVNLDANRQMDIEEGARLLMSMHRSSSGRTNGEQQVLPVGKASTSHASSSDVTPAPVSQEGVLVQPTPSGVSNQAKAAKHGTKRAGSPRSTQATFSTGNNNKRLCVVAPNVAGTIASAESLEIVPNQAEPVANGVSPNREEEEEEAGDGQPLDPDEYFIERILERRWNHLTREYYYHIKWHGFDERQNTWEPRSHIMNNGDMVEAFDRQISREARLQSREQRRNVALNQQSEQRSQERQMRQQRRLEENSGQTPRSSQVSTRGGKSARGRGRGRGGSSSAAPTLSVQPVAEQSSQRASPVQMLFNRNRGVFVYANRSSNASVNVEVIRTNRTPPQSRAGINIVLPIRGSNPAPPELNGQARVVDSIMVPVITLARQNARNNNNNNNVNQAMNEHGRALQALLQIMRPRNARLRNAEVRPNAPDANAEAAEAPSEEN